MWRSVIRRDDESFVRRGRRGAMDLDETLQKISAAPTVADATTELLACVTRCHARRGSDE
jgi:hypothetical protein